MALSCRKLNSYLKVISRRVGCAKNGVFSSVLDFAKIWIVERTKYSVWTPVQMLLVEGELSLFCRPRRGSWKEGFF